MRVSHLACGIEDMYRKLVWTNIYHDLSDCLLTERQIRLLDIRSLGREARATKGAGLRRTRWSESTRRSLIGISRMRCGITVSSPIPTIPIGAISSCSGIAESETRGCTTTRSLHWLNSHPSKRTAVRIGRVIPSRRKMAPYGADSLELGRGS